MNSIFNRLFETNIKNFIYGFSEDAESIFKNSENKLIHPGEYGVYREKATSALISSVIPRHLSISDGFVITSKDDVSTQCDIIIYDCNESPIVEDNLAQFFLVETVAAIGEVKSKLSKSQMKEALLKLAKNKALGERVRGGKPLKLDSTKTYSPLTQSSHQISTFLICNKFDFKIESLNFNSIYRDTPFHLRHDFILSLHDGIIVYEANHSKFPIDKQNDLKSMGFDISKNSIENHPIKFGEKLDMKFYEIQDDHPLDPVKFFLNFIYQVSRNKKFATTSLEDYWTSEKYW